MSRTVWRKAALAAAVVVVGFAVWLLMHSDNALTHWFESMALSDSVHAMGPWGPVAVIALMTVAILVSPLPSAPIALAAGAVYGHTWGTLYVVIGSELGAMAAFLLARYLGYEFVQQHFGARLSAGLAGSQRMLMITVFVSRLLPFVSFDVVSYAAGLTVLSLPRFAVATFAGILPASFLLAHFGSTLSTDTSLSGWLIVAVLGALGVTPLVVHLLHKKG